MTFWIWCLALIFMTSVGYLVGLDIGSRREREMEALRRAARAREELSRQMRLDRVAGKGGLS